MELSAILALVNAIGPIFTTAMNMRADLSIDDQATLDAALKTAREGALAAVAQADADLGAFAG